MPKYGGLSDCRLSVLQGDGCCFDMDNGALGRRIAASVNCPEAVFCPDPVVFCPVFWVGRSIRFENEKPVSGVLPLICAAVCCLAAEAA